MPDLAQKFAKRLKSLIQNGGIKKSFLAKKVGITSQSLSNYLAGRVPDDPHVLIRLADFFGVTVDYMLTGKSEWGPGIFINGHKIPNGNPMVELIEDLVHSREDTLMRVKALLEAEKLVAKAGKKKKLDCKIINMPMKRKDNSS